MDYGKLESYIGKTVADGSGVSVRITGIGTPGTMFCEPIDNSPDGPFWIATAYCEIGN